MTVASTALARRVTDAYADPDGFTAWESLHMGIAGQKRRALTAALGEGGAGAITPDERGQLANAGFDDDFIGTLAGSDGRAAFNTRIERLSAFPISPDHCAVADEERERALSLLASFGPDAADSAAIRYLTLFHEKSPVNRPWLIRGVGALCDALGPARRQEILEDVLAAMDDPSDPVRLEAIRYLKQHWTHARGTPLENAVVTAAARALTNTQEALVLEAMDLVADVYRTTQKIDDAAIGPLTQMLIRGEDPPRPERVSISRHRAMLLIGALRESAAYRQAPLHSDAEKTFFCVVGSRKVMGGDQIEAAEGHEPWGWLADNIFSEGSLWGWNVRHGALSAQEIAAVDACVCAMGYCNSGGCFAGDATLFLASGEPIPFEELFSRFAAQEGIVHVPEEEGPNDIVLVNPNANASDLLVASRDDATGAVRYEIVKKMYAHSIQTGFVDIGYEGRDGQARNISTTENHPLAVCDALGNTQDYLRAADLDLGAFLCMEGSNVGRITGLSLRPIEGTIYHLHTQGGDHNYMIAPPSLDAGLTDAIVAHNLK